MKKPVKKPTSKKPVKTVAHKSKGKAWPATDNVVVPLAEQMMINQGLICQFCHSGFPCKCPKRGGQYAAPSIEDNETFSYGENAGREVPAISDATFNELTQGLREKAAKQPTLAEKIAEKRAASAGPKSTLVPNAEQSLAIAKVKRGFKVLVLIAGAGAGKTSTLRMVADEMEGNGQYTAFNNSLVADSTSKFQGTTVACNTTHSLAFRAIGSKYAHRLGGQRIKSDRVAAILGIKEFSCQLPGAEVDGKPSGEGVPKPVIKRLPASLVASFVMGAIKKFCQSADKVIAASHFRYVDGIDYPPGTTTNNDKLKEYLLPYARKAWLDITNTQGTLLFAHDHYVKIWQLSNPVIPADYILLDEAQDTAPVMLDILQQQTCPIILVGDSAQQIYEWRGAVDAMAAFPDAERCYLTQSFRFGQKIADVANAILKTFDTPTDLRLRGLETLDSKVEKIEEPTAILCRTNAVAISSMLNALALGKKPFLVGGTSDVISFVQAIQDLQQGKSTSHPELACFDSWTEVQEYAKSEDGGDLQLMVKLITAFGCVTILNALKSMPLEAEADLVISTAHKSKGRQWAKVKVASDFPTKSKSTDADRKLLYVTCTRAQEVLDVTSCPFFTGNDAIDLLGAGDKVAAPVSAVAPTVFTWAKGEGDTWLVRGPKGMSGKTVSIVAKSGKQSYRRLGQEVSSNEVAALYRV